MKTKVRCNTCKFGDWGYKGEIPCKDCVGFHKWAEKLPVIVKPKSEIELECECGNQAKTLSPHPLTGFVYNSNWHIRCTVCSRKMTEVKNEKKNN